MSGYLDEGVPASSSSLLLAQLQQQGYSRQIPPSSRAGLRIDDIDVEAETDDQLSLSSWDSQEEDRQAQEEWDESMKQLNLAIQVMVLPFFGKWLGRKWSYWRE
ncbi:hypothetical protein CBS101457_000772 [Exobasidium rhododendri]|nr:hypothetical protein CBS101457_000772 [Exobasidium rhododendri]